MPVAETEFEEPILLEAQDNFEEDQAEQPAVPAPPKASKPIVGIIYPPPEVRNIVDKTASFVARNGPEFETRIRQNEQNNPKFNFLQTGDPYNAYYLHKVKEIQEGKVPPPSAAETEIVGIKPPQQVIDEAKKKKQSELLKQVEQPFVPKDPPAEFEFVADPPSISAHDLDVVKLTAQFVARNGRQFLSTLMTREQRNYQFDFLRPQHSLFQYFTKLLEQYTKVLIPSKDIVKKLEKEDKKKVLDDVKYRANWIRHQEAQKRKEEEEIEKERMAYASIDWHDFVVVETVDYQPFESGNFPPPTNPQEVGARVLLQDRILQGQIPEKEPSSEDNFTALDDTEVQDMEEDSDSSSEDDDEPSLALGKQPPSMPGMQQADRDEVIIKKGYDPKQPKNVLAEKVFTAATPEEYTISPITGERIPVSKLQEHMRIGLLDPRWREQNARQLMERATQESPDASGPAVYESLKLFAERRSDIFGTGIEETSIGKKAGEAERIPGLPWNPNPEPLMSDLAPPAAVAASLTSEEKSEESKKESIGPSIEPPAPRPPMVPQPPPNMQPPPGILQPPAPPMPQMPGIIRPVGGLGMPPPPGQQPPPPPGVMLSSLAGVRPLLGIPQPGFPQFNPVNPAPPGTLGPRPPLLAPAPPVLPPNIQPPPPPQSAVPPPLPQPPQEDEPATKKAKTEESLIPEAQFLASNKSPASFTVALPSVPDKPEMNLNGQLISFTMALTEPVSALKSKINESIGLAPGKQKLRLVEGLFFKDSNTLAFYNVGENANVHLSLKERGASRCNNYSRLSLGYFCSKPHSVAGHELEHTRGQRKNYS
ncbi:unnamed protein product [Allacma fusca]|uniref:Splicing factor 3A subunit 1 n=1 Tax=Allacma fusca TaxID=39272 RepID=A0A8J2LNC7_9HEXA|nr:unnamed protein product [Allacma fusca]